MRTFITLDPEYLPWAPQTPNVKLRKKHNKLLEAVLPLLALSGMMGGIWLYLNRGTLTQGDDQKLSTVVTAALPDVAVVTGESVTQSQTFSAAVPTMGKYGALTLLMRKEQVTLYCNDYKLLSGNVLLRHGSTMTNSRLMINNELVYARGIMVDVRDHKKLTVVCDGKTVSVP